MWRTKKVEDKRQATSPRGGLLAIRVLNALPYSNTVKDFYSKTKESNQMLKVGLNMAESCAVAVSSPFVRRYAAIDRFAASQLEKLEDRYGVDLVAKSVGAVAYPIGYSLGLAGFARNKAVGMATPVVEYTYEVADMVIDQLLPPDYDETLEDEYRKMSALQQKSPFRLIKERANMESVVRLPTTAFILSMNMFSSAFYICTGFASMSVGRMLSSATTLVDNINTQFEHDLKHPWAAISNADMTKLYNVIVFHGVKNVNTAIKELEDRALELSQYLENHKLPYNSQVVKYVASRLRWIERRLIKLGGVRLISTSEDVSGAKPSRRTVKPHARIQQSTPSKLRNSAEERFPTIMLGEGQSAWPEHVEEEHDEPEHHEEHLSQHKLEVLADRAPTMMWIPATSQKRKAHDQEEAIAPKPKEVAVKPKSVSKPKASKDIVKPVEVEAIKAPEVKETIKAPEVKETIKPEDVTEEKVEVIEKEEVKPKHHRIRKHHKKATKPVVWPKVDSSEFVRLAEANKYKEEMQAKEKVHFAEPTAEVRHEEEIEEEEEVDNADEYGYVPAKPVHGHLLSQEAAKEIAEEMLAPRKLHVPITPVNSPAEVLSNNPFGDILVEDDEVVRGPELEEEQLAKLEEQKMMARQRDLQKQTLHELIAEVGNRLEKVEKRAEENSQAGPWQSAKHPAHVEVEAPVAEAPAEVPAAENNPFAKLSTDTTEDPLSLGMAAH